LSLADPADASVPREKPVRAERGGPTPDRASLSLSWGFAGGEPTTVVARRPNDHHGGHGSI